jgi:hypothetical protein
MKAETFDIGSDKSAITKYILSNINTDDDTVKFIFSGYLDAIEEGAGLAGVDLDMTYDTANNIMPAIITLANHQNKTGYPDNRHNAEITMKTLAAYLTLMAVNNHGARIKVDRKGNPRKDERPDLWSDQYYLRINNKRDSDILPYAIEGINAAPIEVDNGFTIDVNPLIGAYIRVTGINLADYGFANLVISFDEMSKE